MTRFKKAVCIATVLLSGAGGAQAASSDPQASSDAIRTFHVHIAEEALVDLRQRVQATRWPDRETVADQSQGLQLAKIQELVRYWGTRRH